MSESEVWNHRDNDGTSSSVVVGDDDDDDDEEEEEEENDVASAGGGVDSEQTDIVNQELSVRSSSSLSMLIANLQLNDDGSNLLVNVPLNSHTQESASSSPSIVSSANNQSALPPIIYGQLNKNQYMLGSVTYYDSFFGFNELERYFPNHKARMSILTWNMSSKAPVNYNTAIQEMLQLKSWQCADDNESLPELYVIGLQETPSSETIIDNLKVGIQAVLGPNYALLKWASVGMLHAAIWIRRELLWSCTTVEMVPVHTRPSAANQIRTKGAIALSFSLFGTLFLFINTHLSAHETNLRTRINQLDKVQQALHLKMDSTQCDGKQLEEKLLNNQIEKIKTTNSANAGGGNDGQTGTNETSKHCEYIFWFGDLNFRLELPTESVFGHLKDIANSKNEDEQQYRREKLMRSDQMSNLMSRGMIFKGFEEALWPPPFWPTYKCKIIGNTTNSVGSGKPSTSAMINSTSSGSNSSSPTQSIFSDGSNLTNTSEPVLANEVKNDDVFYSDDSGSIFNYDETRVPSYTDRILFKSKVKQQISNIKCVQYNSINTINSSDHKPVYAMFEVDLESGGPRVPLRMAKYRGALSDSSMKKSQSSSNLNRLLDGKKGNISFFERRFAKRPKNKLKNNKSGLLGPMLKLDKLAHLNAGAFERQVFLDGLRLRNNLIHWNNTKTSLRAQHSLIKSQSLDYCLVDNVETRNGVTKAQSETLESGKSKSSQSTDNNEVLIDTKTSSFCLIM